MLAPKLRFKQDIGKVCPFWELRRLGDIADVYQPQTISQSDLTPQGFDVYGANGIIGKYDKFNHEHEQVIVTCRGSTCGAVTFTKAKSWITGNAMVLNVDDNKEIQKKFLYYYMLQTKLDYLITGSGQPQITGSIKKHPINIPNTEEQQKIATFLTAVDTRLSLMEQKHALLQQYKKGVMQQIFSQKIRFRRDDGGAFGDWIEVLIRDVADLKNGYSFKSSEYDPQGSYKIITISNVQAGYLDTTRLNFIAYLPDDIQKHQILSIGDILISMTGNVGRICKVDSEGYLLNQRVGKLMSKKIHNEYFFQVLNDESFQSKMQSQAKGAAQGNISINDILDYKIVLPTDWQEQTKIANFLSALDTKLTMLQTQIGQAKAFKQGLLQQMFV